MVRIEIEFPPTWLEKKIGLKSKRLYFYGSSKDALFINYVTRKTMKSIYSWYRTIIIRKEFD